MAVKVVVLSGDGVGPEVTTEAQKVLQAVAGRFGQQVHFARALIGGAAIEQTGDPLPEDTLHACRQADAVLLGAVGGPRWSSPYQPVRPEQGLLRLRKELGLFANLRPVMVHAALADATPLRPERIAGIDMLVIRELTGGIYFGPRGRRSVAGDEQAYDTMVYGVSEIERIVRLAAKLARTRRGRLTSVDKANVLESSRLWRAVTQRVMRDEFRDVECDHVLVDAAAMHLIRDPARFDVIVTSNMFGDILTDEASVLAGSMGLLPSASVGQGGLGLYEPIHGSAPDIAGEGVANPIGAILSAAMLCRLSLGWPQAATCIERAVARVLDEGVRTTDIIGAGQRPVGTALMGTRVAAAVGQVGLSAEEQEGARCVPM